MWNVCGTESFLGTKVAAASHDFGGLLTCLETTTRDLLSLQWPSPPRNVLIIKKDGVPAVTDSVIEYAKSVGHLT
jgi:hypothetical protein